MTAAPTLDELLDALDVTPGQVGDLLADLRTAIAQRIGEVVEAQRGDGAIPVVEFDDVCTASPKDGVVESIRAAGCVVVRRTFAPDVARDWDAELADYLERNAFRERLLDRYPAAATSSRIWPIYWSRPQVFARQHVRMVALRRFLNGLWSVESDGQRWLDPDRDIGYPDRIRRREPGAVAQGLSMHVDSPASGGWPILENQRVFGGLLTGGLEHYDPFDAAHRTTQEVVSPAGSTVFRTFQGWTALSEMHPDDGVLHVVPIPEAIAYRFVHGVAGELGLIDGVPIPAPHRDSGDELVQRALVPIPVVEPGDTVWWHGDLYHSVGSATNDSRSGNVMYIGSSPRCARNDAYAATAYPRFVEGRSPTDFPGDDFEVGFVGRATPDDLDAVGHDQFAQV